MNVREWALPVYTILLQIAIGTLLCLWIMRFFGGKKIGHEAMDQIVRDPLLIILVTIFLGMIGAHFHLSRPYLSFLSIRNFQSSWLSREIVFTLIFFVLNLFLCYLQWFHEGSWKLRSTLGWVAIADGFVTVYCMGSIYLLPAQAAWDTPETIFSYYGSMLLLGVMALAAILIMDLTERAKIVKQAVKGLAVVGGVVLIPVIVLNLSHLQWLRTGAPLAQTSYELLIDLYTPLLVARFVMLLAGVGILVFSVFRMNRKKMTIQELFNPVYLSCLMVIVGEVLGRFLFYAAHIRTGL